MAQVLAMLQADRALQLTIEGHTDSIGRQAYNQTLSADRAEAVKAWLAAHGVEAARLTSVGFGDTRPLADNAAEQGRSQNRRVELVRR
jgi:OmpA-OmpF porin, OOP family